VRNTSGRPGGYHQRGKGAITAVGLIVIKSGGILRLQDPTLALCACSSVPCDLRCCSAEGPPLTNLANSSRSELPVRIFGIARSGDRDLLRLDRPPPIEGDATPSSGVQLGGIAAPAS